MFIVWSRFVAGRLVLSGSVAEVASLLAVLPWVLYKIISSSDRCWLVSLWYLLTEERHTISRSPWFFYGMNCMSHIPATSLPGIVHHKNQINVKLFLRFVIVVFSISLVTSSSRFDHTPQDILFLQGNHVK